MKEISAALVRAQKAFGPALKSSTNPHFRSKYADLSACVEAVIDALNSNGIALVQKCHPSDNGVLVETLFVHESGERFDCGMLHVPASKNDPQGYGSALTYARRYSLMAACGIAPEDDDGNAASKSKAPIIPARPAIELDPETEAFLQELSMECMGLVKEGKASEADERIRAQKLDGDQEIALANMMDSKSRTAITKARREWNQQQKG